jgi:hypothetical protein
MGMNDFAPYLKKYGCFVVRNVTPDRQKTIKIFNYPILFNTTRDLLQIPGIGEADLRASLLKGELRHKILAKDIIVECSDIDLLQFNLDQKAFLQNAGIVNGLEVESSGLGELTSSQHKTLRQLIHLADGVGGPMEGFASGAYRETLPAADPFPTSIIWWESSAKLKKIVEKTLVYDGSFRITTTSWKVYDASGSLLATVTDTFTYSGSTQFETSRTRTIV